MPAVCVKPRRRAVLLRRAVHADAEARLIFARRKRDVLPEREKAGNVLTGAKFDHRAAGRARIRRRGAGIARKRFGFEMQARDDEIVRLRRYKRGGDRLLARVEFLNSVAEKGRKFGELRRAFLELPERVFPFSGLQIGRAERLPRPNMLRFRLHNLRQQRYRLLRLAALQHDRRGVKRLEGKLHAAADETRIVQSRACREFRHNAGMRAHRNRIDGRFEKRHGVF